MDPQAIFDTLIRKVGGAQYAAVEAGVPTDRRAVSGSGAEAGADVPPDEDDFHV
jgi:hypothetical protein